jgi:hypothetical protein
MIAIAKVILLSVAAPEVLMADFGEKEESKLTLQRYEVFP